MARAAQDAGGAVGVFFEGDHALPELFCQAPAQVFVGLGRDLQRLAPAAVRDGEWFGDAEPVPGGQFPEVGEAEGHGGDGEAAFLGEADDAGIDGVSGAAGSVGGDGEGVACPGEAEHGHEGGGAGAAGGAAHGHEADAGGDAGDVFAVARAADHDGRACLVVVHEGGQLVCVPEGVDARGAACAAEAPGAAGIVDAMDGEEVEAEDAVTEEAGEVVEDALCEAEVTAHGVDPSTAARRPQDSQVVSVVSQKSWNTWRRPCWRLAVLTIRFALSGAGKRRRFM